MTALKISFDFMLLFVAVAASVWAVAYLMWHGRKGSHYH